MRLSMVKWVMILLAWPAGATCVSDLRYPTGLTLPSLERWSRGSVFERASPENECKMVKSLIKSFDVLGEATALEPPQRKRLRGTHSKGVCFSGTFRRHYDSKLSETRKFLLQNAEVFSLPGPRTTHVRFANGASHVQPDWVKDVRALSFKVGLGAGRTQDFSLNNVPRFQIDSLKSFVRVMEMTRGMLTGKIEKKDGGPVLSSMFEYFRVLHGPFAAAHDLYKLSRVKKLAEEDTGFHDSYLTQTYWSTTPFALGDSNRDVSELARVVKFGAVPCGERRAPLGSEEEARAASHLRGVERENYLGEDLRAAVNYKPRCFRVFAEFLEDERSVGRGGSLRASRMIEDSSIKWDVPSFTVGELMVESAVDQGICDDPRHGGVNVTRNQVGVVGVGALNRARSFVEETSQKNR